MEGNQDTKLSEKCCITKTRTGNTGKHQKSYCTLRENFVSAHKAYTIQQNQLSCSFAHFFNSVRSFK